jgi:ATP-dependent RNA helicase RhlE
MNPDQTQLSWLDLKLSPELQALIDEAGYKSPSPVQAQAIPEALAGRDLLVSSQTGSGKTASFVLPIVERFKGKNGTFILALAPTREIAQQTGAVFEMFGGPLGLKVAVCIGGASMAVEKEALASSPQIIVATPGRLCDHLERGHVWLEFIQCLVFDEADRMLEMGFSKQIDIITEQIPKERQTLMFSATYAPSVEKLARKALRDPKEVVIEKTKESAPKIEQQLFWVSEERKLSTLLGILRQEPGTMFVFVKAKERAYQIWRSLLSAGFKDATYIHSDLPQDAREQAVADFKAGKYRVIIATDVMGRGIDVDDVAHVVNYDVPREPEDYVHRIGRTGRRGLTGHASTFAVPGKDDRTIKAIEKLRGVPAPAYQKEEERKAPAPARGPRQPRAAGEQGNRPSRGPREGGEGRSREARPRDERPRDQQNRDQRPRGDRPNRPSSEGKTAPSQVSSAPVSVKKMGFLERVKSFFKRS